MIGPFGGAREDQWPCGWQLGVGETQGEVDCLIVNGEVMHDASELYKFYSFFAAAELESA